MSRILDQWEELQLHFNLTMASEHCYMVLHSMYSDPQNLLYLTCEVQSAVKAFEGEQMHLELETDQNHKQYKPLR